MIGGCRRGEEGGGVQENCGWGVSGAAAATTSAPEQGRCFESSVGSSLNGNE